MVEHPHIMEAAMVARVLHLDPVVHLSAPPLHRAVRVATALQISEQKQAEHDEAMKKIKRR